MTADDAGFNALINFIREQNEITLIAHISPDGDTLGSALAVYLLLTRMGKKCEVVCDNPVPKIYAFFPDSDKVVTPENAIGYHAVIAIDCADRSRMGRAAKLFDNAEKTALIDHHVTNPGFAGINLIIPQAAAVAEIINSLYLKMDMPVNKDAACCIYAGIVTDTGNLSYDNTTPSALRIIADFVEQGLDIAKLNRLIYRTVPYCKTRVQGYLNSKIVLEHGGDIGISVLTREQMLSYNAADEDCEGVIDCIRDIDCVKIAVFIREGADGSFKVSLRSKETGDVGRIAKKFGGGGHKRAAGYTSYSSLSTVIANVIEEAAKALKDGT